MITSPILDRLELVAKVLKARRIEAVYIGGAVCELYKEDPAAPAFRPTDDVDCVIEISTNTEYFKLEEKLRAIGFKHDKEGHLCRKLYNGIKVDFMPSNPGVIGLSGKWLREGMKHTVTARLRGGTEIEIMALPYFLATKFEAFFERGKGDFYASDFEDIVNVLSYRESYKDFDGISGVLRGDLRTWSRTVMDKRGLLEIIRGHLEWNEPPQIAEKVFSFFRNLSS